MIRIDMIRQDTRHPEKRRRHQGRASCEVAGRRFEAEGPARYLAGQRILRACPMYLV